MSNPLTTELDAVHKRLEIIANNTSDENTSKLAKDCATGISQMVQQVKTILELETPEEAKT